MLRQMSRGALAEMRTLLLELRPAAVVETSLEDLLRQLGEAFTGREGLPVTMEVEGRCELPADLEALIMQCLAKKPEDRPQTAREIRERLAEINDVPLWRQADARAWWQQHGDMIRPDASVHSEITRTLAVDPDSLR